MTSDPLEDILDISDQVVEFDVITFPDTPTNLTVQFDFNLDMEIYSSQGRPDIQSVLDLLHTVDAVAFEVRDSSGNLLDDSNIRVQSAAGVDYMSINTVPEPSSFLLLLTAGVLVSGIRKYGVRARRSE